MNPYDHNPYATAGPRSLHSERDANRALRKTAGRRRGDMTLKELNRLIELKLMTRDELMKEILS